MKRESMMCQFAMLWMYYKGHEYVNLAVVNTISVQIHSAIHLTCEKGGRFLFTEPEDKLHPVIQYNPLKGNFSNKNKVFSLAWKWNSFMHFLFLVIKR